MKISSIIPIGLAVSLFACVPVTYQLELSPRVGPIADAPKLDVSVAVLITPESEAYQPSPKPNYIYGEGAGLGYIIPLGKALKKTSLDAYRQMSPGLAVIDRRADAAKYDLVIEPRIASFRYRIPLIAPFTAETIVSLELGLVVYGGGRPVWERTYRVPDVKGPVYTASLGKSGSYGSLAQATNESLATALRMSVRDFTRDPSLRAAVSGIAPRPSRAAAKAAPPPRPTPVLSKPVARPVGVSFKKGPQRPYDVAVIIGNADYGTQGKDIPDVIPAIADAQGIRRYVIQALGISEDNILYLENATQSGMLAVFGNRTDYRGQLFNYVKPGRSRVFVYFSGHGAPGGEDGGSYLVPTDSQASMIKLNGYPLSTLYRNLSKIPAASVTVVLEACFSGASEGGSVIPNASPIYLKARQTEVPANITVIAAGGANQIASWERDKSSGLFTKYFLKGMSGEADRPPTGNGDGVVGYDELGAYLKETLTYFARRYYGRDQTARIVVGRPGS